MCVKNNVLELRLLNWDLRLRQLRKVLDTILNWYNNLIKVKWFKQKFLLVYIGSKSDLENNRLSFFIEYSSTLESKLQSSCLFVKFLHTWSSNFFLASFFPGPLAIYISDEKAKMFTQWYHSILLVVTSIMIIPAPAMSSKFLAAQPAVIDISTTRTQIINLHKYLSKIEEKQSENVQST